MNHMISAGAVPVATAAAKRAPWQMPPLATEIDLAPDVDVWARIGHGGEVAAVDAGVFCPADQITRVPVRGGDRLSAIAVGANGTARFAISGQSAHRGAAHSWLLDQFKPDLWFDFSGQAQMVNNAGELHVPGVLRGKAAQTTSSAVPVFDTINGLGALNFDASDDTLAATGVLDICQNTDRLLIGLAFELDALPAGSRQLLFVSNAGAGTRLAINVNAQGAVLVSGRGLDGDGVATVQSADAAVAVGVTVLAVEVDYASATTTVLSNGKKVLNAEALTGMTAGTTSDTASASAALIQSTLAATLGEVLARKGAGYTLAELSARLRTKWGV